MTPDSQQLLADFVARGSEEAFRELVGRYLNLVYSVALRILEGNTQLAEEVSQTVFLSLARKGPGLSNKVMIGGWLHQHTYHVATRALRGERRRQLREQEAFEMHRLSDDSGAHWRLLSPVLDEAITKLGNQDRTAIVLRYFEQRDFRSVGAALGSTPEAARVRVNRALQKLHELLKRRGVALSAAALATALGSGVVTAAPSGLAVTISSAALGGAAAATGFTFTLVKLMATTQMKIGVIALIAGGVAATFVIQHRSDAAQTETLRQQIAQLQADNEALSNRITQVSSSNRVLVPELIAVAAPVTQVPAAPQRSLYSLVTNRTSMVKLTAVQAEAYLKENKRSASSLLAAFRTSDDPALLQEAMEKYPNDPQVAFEAALRKEAQPAERRVWLDSFKQSAPENALADYLSAADHFKAGETAQALQDIAAGSGKTQFQDYSTDRAQSDEEAYRAAGFPVAEAKILSSAQLAFPQLSQVNELSGRLIDLAKSYQQNGDEPSRQAVLSTAANLGQRYGTGASGETVLAQTVGMRVERSALEAMDPAQAYGSSGGTVQDRLAQLTQQRADMRSLTKQADPILQMMSDQDWISYQNRIAVFGEESALRWLVSKHTP
jgi:RNA polymerase sigma factor (sigma-70 family)